MRLTLTTTLSLILLAFTPTTLITAYPTPAANIAAGPDPLSVPEGSTHFARSVPEILAQKKAAEKREAEMGGGAEGEKKERGLERREGESERPREKLGLW